MDFDTWNVTDSIYMMSPAGHDKQFNQSILRRAKSQNQSKEEEP